MRKSQKGFWWKRVVRFGAEEITNGAFTTDTGWTRGTGWTIDAGDTNVATSDATQSADSDLSQTINPVDNAFYKVTFTVSGRNAGNVTAVVGDTEGTDRADNLTYIENIKAGSGADFDIRADLDFNGDIDNV